MVNIQIKECKANILKRLLYLEEKHNEPGRICSFNHLETLFTASNIAVWNVIKRGLITPETVRIAIYQLEKSGLVEIVDREYLKLTDKGREVSKRIRPMVLAEIPDNLLEGEVEASTPDKTSESGIKCPKCGKINKKGSSFCAYCGAKLKEKSKKVCPYCGSKVRPQDNFCSNCGASLD